VILYPEAEADLMEARDWYEQQRVGLGTRFVLCVDETLERIARTPTLYAVVYRDVRRAVIRRFPYVV